MKPFLPTISACGDRPPEVFIFRLGVAVGSFLVAVASLAIYSSDKPYSGSVVNLTLGLVAAFGLGVVAVVSDREMDSVLTGSRWLVRSTLDLHSTGHMLYHNRRLFCDRYLMC